MKKNLVINPRGGGGKITSALRFFSGWRWRIDKPSTTTRKKGYAVRVRRFRKMKKILVINPKGGCGKTTVATNLASYYALWGVPTALVDCDPQRSSSEWLEARPANFEKIHALRGGGEMRYPKSVQRVVVDAPARTSPAKNLQMFRAADVVLIPVLPSAIDIRAASSFLGETLMSGAMRGTRVGIIANRVRENTLIYGKLRQFLRNIDIAFVTTLRDTQNYVRAAQLGIGIFEMAPSQVEPDLGQWRPLIRWVDAKRG